LAMGSRPELCLANGGLHKFDENVKSGAKLYYRYMDDILRDIKYTNVEEKLDEINQYHPNLKFTIENEKDGCLPFLDMEIKRSESTLSSTWYSKSTSTGLTMNYHALASVKYKKSVVSGFVYRIFYACSSWKDFHISLKKAKRLLENNQYPSSFYEPIINKTLTNIVETQNKETADAGDEESEKEPEEEKKLIFIQYRGKVTEKFESALRRMEAPCKVISTINKVKSCLPSLKQPIEKSLKSSLVYEISCPRCASCYVGQTTRHLLFRMKEHKRIGSPVGSHFKACGCEVTMDNIKVLITTYKSVYHLMTLEALFIDAIKPSFPFIC